MSKPTFVVLGAALALSAWLLVRAWPDSGPDPLRLANGSAFVELNAMRSTAVAEFADGSRVTAHPGARVTSLAQTRSEVLLMLHSGRAKFEVAEGGARYWTVEAGLARVQVVGTVFVVERTERGVLVEVSRGVVLVRSESLDDGVRRLGAGKRLLVPVGSADARTAAASSSVPRREPEQEVTVPAPGGAATSQPAASRDADVRPQSSAAPPMNATARVTRLLEQADTARLNGDLLRTEQLLERVANEFPADARAALSAFQVGVMRLNRGDARGAELWLNTAMKRGPAISLLEDCYWRLIQAQSSLGDRAKVRRTAEAYLSQFPRGRHRQAIQAELGPVDAGEREE